MENNDFLYGMIVGGIMGLLHGSGINSIMRQLTKDVIRRSIVLITCPIWLIVYLTFLILIHLFFLLFVPCLCTYSYIKYGNVSLADEFSDDFEEFKRSIDTKVASIVL